VIYFCVHIHGIKYEEPGIGWEFGHAIETLFELKRA
jgi:hypothetical protein